METSFASKEKSNSFTTYEIFFGVFSKSVSLWGFSPLLPAPVYFFIVNFGLLKMEEIY